MSALSALYALYALYALSALFALYATYAWRGVYALYARDSGPASARSKMSVICRKFKHVDESTRMVEICV
eukprot:2299065-Lingulodinium_polyedra.AAC.1